MFEYSACVYVHHVCSLYTEGIRLAGTRLKDIFESPCEIEVESAGKNVAYVLFRVYSLQYLHLYNENQNDHENLMKIFSQCVCLR